MKRRQCKYRTTNQCRKSELASILRQRDVSWLATRCLLSSHGANEAASGLFGPSMDMSITNTDVATFLSVTNTDVATVLSVTNTEATVLSVTNTDVATVLSVSQTLTWPLFYQSLTNTDVATVLSVTDTDVVTVLSVTHTDVTTVLSGRGDCEEGPRGCQLQTMGRNSSLDVTWW